MSAGSTTPRGSLGLVRIPAPPVRPAIATPDDVLRYGTARGVSGVAALVGERARWQRRNRENLERGLRDVEAAYDATSRTGAVAIFGALWLAKVSTKGDQCDLGLASCRVVTTTGVGYLVDAWQNLVELENMKYHGIGTGTNAEAVGNTALQTELTTQYSTDNTRPTGTLAEAAANIFETVATITVDASVAITEHGIFSQAATGGGVMIDRSVFSAVNLASGESIQATYQFTFTSGG